MPTVVYAALLIRPVVIVMTGVQRRLCAPCNCLANMLDQELPNLGEIPFSFSQQTLDGFHWLMCCKGCRAFR